MENPFKDNNAQGTSGQQPTTNTQASFAVGAEDAEYTPVQSFGDTPDPVTPSSEPQVTAATSEWSTARILKWLGIAALIALLFAGVTAVIVFQRNQRSLNSALPVSEIGNRYNSLQLPLDDFIQEGALVVDGNKTLTINGQLTANNTLILTPTPQPGAAKVGQIYYDKTTNQLAYFNGTEFVSVRDSDETLVSSLGGVSGAVLLGPGLAIAGGTVTNSGVLSVQGESGAVTFTAGNGIDITGTTISNIGVVGLAAGTANLVVTDDGSGNLTISSVGTGTGTVSSPGGTAGSIVVFTGAQTIEDSILTQAAGTVTANGNFSVTGSLSLSTALSVVNGGTGATSLAANGVLLGNGTSPITSVVAGLAGQCLMSTAGAPVWQACPGGGGGVTSLNGQTGAVSIANASAAGGVVTINDASTSQKGIAQFNSTNFTVAAGVVNTIQNIDPTANPTFVGINTSTITPNGTPLTVGSNTQDLTLQGANTIINEISGANTSSLTFAAPTANVTYRLQTAAAGTYDVCTTAGNCVNLGGSVTTLGGTTNRLAKFTGAQTIGDSLIADNGSLVTVNGNLTVTGTTTLSTPLAVASGGTGSATAAGARANLGAASSGANSDITSISGLTTALSVTQGGTGTNSLTANGVLLGNGTSPVSSLVAGLAGQCLMSTAGAPVWQACPGGGGVTSLNGLSGALTIANASAAGSTITINDASTSQKGIAQFNSTNFTVTTGNVNTIQDIHVAATPTFGALTLSSSQATSPMLLINNTNAGATGNLLDLQLNGASRLAVTPAGNMTLAGTVNGQTISSTASFTGSVAVAGAANLNGGATVTGTLTANTITPTGAMTIGSTAQNLTVQGASVNLTATDGANTANLTFVAPTADVTYRLQTAAAGTYDICTTAGNCAGVGGGVTTSGGTTNRLAKFTGSQAIGDSIISDDGSTVTVGGVLSVNTITPSGAMTVGATGQDLTLQGAGVALTATDSGVTNTLTFATPSGTNKTITVPNATGTVAVSAGGPLALDASGNLTCPTCVTSGGGGGGQAAVDSLNSLTGALTIANASGSGSTITIDDASTSQKGIAQFNSTNFTATGGVVNTIQDINTTAAPTFGRLTVTSNQATNDMLLVNNTNTGASGNLLALQLNGANRFTVDPAGNVVAAGTITSGTINGQTISSSANFTGTMTVAGLATFSGGASVVGTLNANTITPTAAMTVGATTQNLTLQGSATSLTSTSGANTTALNFQTPTANVTYRLLTAAAGTYDICTTAGNCVGLGSSVTSAGGTTNRIAKFTGAQTIGDSNISDDGTTVAVLTTLNVNTITPTGAMTVGAANQDLTLQGATVSLAANAGGFTNNLVFATPSGSNKTITLPNATGTVAVSASGPLALDASGNITCSNCVTAGGADGGQAAVDSLNGLTGTLTLANATGSGGTVTIDDASTSQKGIAQFNSTNFTASSGLVNTVQDINTTAAPTFGRLTVTSNQATNDMLVINNTNTSAAGNLLALQLNGASRFSVDGAGNVTAAGTITSGNINGQTITSAANFTGSVTVGTTLNVNTVTPSAAMTVGATNQNLTLQGATTTLSSTSGANTTNLTFQTPTANVTYRLLTATAGTYDICTTVGNCAGVGGGVTTSGGTTNRIAKFTGAQTLGDSNISDNGTTVAVTGAFSVSGGSTYSLGSSGSGSITSSGAITITAGGGSTWSTSSGALTVTAATNLSLNSTGTLSVGSSSTSTLNVGSASNNARTINIGTAGTTQAQTVNIGSGGTSTSTTTIQGGTGATAISLTAAAGGSINSTVTGAGNINFNTGAGIFAKATTNSANTFQVQNASGRGILTADTSNSRVVLGNITSTSGQGVAGSLVFADGTNDNFGLTLNTTTLTANRTITLPDETGTVCLQNSSGCGFAAASGSANYINNTTTVQTNANIAVQSAADASVTVLIQNRATQSADPLRIVDSNSNLMFNVDTFGSGSIANQFTIGTYLGVGTSASSGTQFRVAVADANTTGLTIFGDSAQVADLMVVDGAGARSLNYTGDGTFALTAGAAQSSSLLRLNETGGAAILTVGATGAVEMKNSANSTTALNVKSSSNANIFTVDTTNGRVGINLGSTNLPAYALDISGDTNTSGVYRVAGTAGISATCSGGQVLQNLVAVGGIVTGGSCAASGSSSTLQQAYTASTGSTTPEIKLDSTRGALDIQDADTTIGAALFNIRAANGSGLGAALLTVGATGQFTSQNSANSTTAFRILNQGGTGMFTVDTTNSRAYIGDTAADATGALLVLDTKNTTGDPTGVDGAMYYNSAMARMRCYVDSTWKFCNDPVGLRWGYNIEDDFAGNADIGILGWTDASLGTGSVTAQVPDIASRPGQTRLATGGTAGGAGAIFFDGATDSGAFFIQGGEEIEFSLKVNALANGTTDYDIRGGLCDLMNSACTNGVYIEYDRDSSTNWRIGTAAGGTRTVTASTKAVATGWTSFRIVANSSSSIDFYAKHEGDSTYTLLGNKSTNIPTTSANRAMGLFHIVKDAGSNATNCTTDIDYFAIRNSFTSPR